MILWMSGKWMASQIENNNNNNQVIRIVSVEMRIGHCFGDEIRETVFQLAVIKKRIKI